MLLNKTYALGDVVTFKLTTGEEVIARYQGETMNEYQVTKPISLVPTQNNSVGMLPPMFSADVGVGTINLQKTAVVFSSHTAKQFADEYTRATSGIKPATSIDGLV